MCILSAVIYTFIALNVFQQNLALMKIMKSNALNVAWYMQTATPMLRVKKRPPWGILLKEHKDSKYGYG